MDRSEGDGWIAQSDSYRRLTEPATAPKIKRDGPTPAAVANAFSMASAGLRAHVLHQLLCSVGTLAFAVVGGGSFIRFLTQTRTVSVEDATRVTASQVFELASYVQQSNPDAVEQILALLSQDASAMIAAGASIAAVVSGLLARRSAGS